jgi:hypothetical protein
MAQIIRWLENEIEQGKSYSEILKAYENMMERKAGQREKHVIKLFLKG